MSDYKPVTREDVADDNPLVLVRRLDTLTREVRSGFELLGERILTAITRIEDRLTDTIIRVDAVERRVAALEAARKPKRKARK